MNQRKVEMNKSAVKLLCVGDDKQDEITEIPDTLIERFYEIYIFLI